MVAFRSAKECYRELSPEKQGPLPRKLAETPSAPPEGG